VYGARKLWRQLLREVIRVGRDRIHYMVMGDEQRGGFFEQQRVWVAGLPHAMQHHYSHSQANEPIGLYRGPLRVSVKGTSEAFDAQGSLALQWLPTPRVAYEAELETDTVTSFRLFGADLGVGVPDTAAASRVPDQIAAQNQQAGTTQDGISIGGWERAISIGGAREVTRVRFGVVNFMGLLGTFIRDGDHPYHGRIDLSACDWSVVLDQRRDYDDLTRQLKTNGGYALTHVGELSRGDGAPFTPVTAKSILEALHYFFSLALGSFTGPLLPVGYDRHGQPLWAEWSSPTIDQWTPVTSWSDGLHPDQLVDLFPLFMDKWRDGYWEEVLRIAIQYYRDANRPQPVQRAIAMAQIVLELLAYALLVENLKKLSKKEYNNQSAYLNFMRLLTHLTIPTHIPEDLAALSTVAHEEGWNSGPQAVTVLRNSVIHPKRSSRRFENQVWIDAWRLIVWYVELSLLSFFGYKGVYRSRLQRERWVGMVARVPWA
jgi:hypothetical protein